MNLTKLAIAGIIGFSLIMCSICAEEAYSSRFNEGPENCSRACGMSLTNGKQMGYWYNTNGAITCVCKE